MERLNNIEERLVQVKGYSLDQARESRRQFEAFMFEDQTNPTPEADIFWHEFILDTRSYADFCQENFGRFVHHIPSNLTPGYPHGTTCQKTTCQRA